MEGGGGQSLSVSGSVQKAWRGTAALEVRPGAEERAYVIQTEDKSSMGQYKTLKQIKDTDTLAIPA